VTADEKELPPDAFPYVRALMRELSFKPAVPLVVLPTNLDSQGLVF
jgi:hypothetical protein